MDRVSRKSDDGIVRSWEGIEQGEPALVRLPEENEKTGSSALATGFLVT
jgi:hypothetical protein